MAVNEWKALQGWFDATKKTHSQQPAPTPDEPTYVPVSNEFVQQWITKDQVSTGLGQTITTASSTDWQPPTPDYWTTLPQAAEISTGPYKIHYDSVKRSLWLPCWIEEADGRVLPAMVKMDLAGPAHEMENAVIPLDHIPANFPPIPPGKKIAAEEIEL